MASWTKDTWPWLVQFSPTLNSNLTLHNAGHDDMNVNGAIGAFVMSNLIILILSTFYMVWRVYSKKKYLTESFKREYCLNGMPPNDPSFQLNHAESQEAMKNAQNTV